MLNKPKKNAAATHIAEVIVRIWQPQPGQYFCISTRDEQKIWKDNFFKRGDLGKVVKFISDHEDYDVYFCPHGFSQRKRRRECAVLPKLLWADLDEADPRTIKFKPTLAFESSPNRYVAIWIVDKTVSEELNHRMTITVGADPSGWDLTQVLRVPGTFNYKYKSAPEVKLMWENGPTHKVNVLEKKLRRVPASKTHGSIEIDPDRYESKAVLRKYGKELSQQVRQLIRDKRVAEKDRSKCIFQIVAGLHEAGASPDEIASVLLDNVYFLDKHGDDEQKLEAEINRCVAKLATPTAEKAGGITAITARQLQKKNFPPLRFVVDGFLIEGLTMLAGKAKMGKSFMCLDFAYAIASGGVVLGSIRCGQGPVLYAALEDNQRRLQRRIKKLFANDATWPTNLHITTELRRIDEGGLEDIKDWVIANDAVAVFIDTLVHVRPTGKREASYEADYADLTPLQKLAGELGIAVVLVHHLRKMVSDDPLDMVTGTTGLTASVDSVLVLYRDSIGTTLYGRGRDFEENIEVAVEFNHGHWALLGDADEVRRSDERKAITTVLGKSDKPMSPSDIATALEKPMVNIRQLLLKMTKVGEIEKHGRGKYKLADIPDT